MPGGRPHGCVTKNKKNKELPKNSKLIPLSDRPGPLLREDVKCCICLSILIEPVTLPCEHALCLNCFKKHVKETSLQCPYCRLRVATWSRRAFKENNLVNVKLWERIKSEFPKLVLTRQLGEDSQTLDPEDLRSVLDQNNEPERPPSGPGNHDLIGDDEEEEFCLPPLPQVKDSAPGDLRKELDAINRKHEEDIENQRLAEENESQKLIRQLQELAEAESSQIQRQNSEKEEADRRLAQELSDQEAALLQEDNAARNERRQSFSLPVARTPTPTPEGNSGGVIYGFVRGNILRKSSSSAVGGNWVADETPRKRPAPSSSSSCMGGGGSKRRKDGHSLPFRLSGSSKSVSSSAGKDHNSNSQNSILNYLSQSPATPVPQKDPAEPSPSRILFRSPKKSAPAATAPSMSAIYQNQVKTGVITPSTTVSVSQFSAFFPISPSKSIKNPTPPNPGPSSSVLKPKNSLEASELDVPSPNSIDLEVNSHFRPIRSEPKTPPRRLPDGTLDNVSLELVKTTPIKVQPIPCFAARKIIEVITVGDSQEDDDEGLPSQITCVPLALLQDSQEYEDEDDFDVTPTPQPEKDAASEILAEEEEDKSKDVVLPPQETTSANLDTPTNAVASVNVTFDLSSLEEDSQLVIPDSEEENLSEHEFPGTSEPCSTTAEDPSSLDCTLQENEAGSSTSGRIRLESESSNNSGTETESQDLDLDLAREQAALLENILARVRQEEEDRRLALKLSKELNKAPVVVRGPDNPYGLRSWLANNTPEKKDGKKPRGKSSSSASSTISVASSSRPNTRGSTRSTASSTVTSQTVKKEDPTQ